MSDDQAGGDAEATDAVGDGGLAGETTNDEPVTTKDAVGVAENGGDPTKTDTRGETESGPNDAGEEGSVGDTLGDVDLDGLDDRLLGLLSWVLETETRARIYVFLRGAPGSTSDEVADGTGLYPSTVREALAGLHDDGYLTREKRAASGAGNNPYEYEAIPPAELVERAAGRVQSELNSVVNLDERLGRDTDHEEPVQITVRSENDE